MLCKASDRYESANDLFTSVVWLLEADPVMPLMNEHTKLNPESRFVNHNTHGILLQDNDCMACIDTA